VKSVLSAIVGHAAGVLDAKQRRELAEALPERRLRAELRVQLNFCPECCAPPAGRRSTPKHGPGSARADAALALAAAIESSPGTDMIDIVVAAATVLLGERVLAAHA
jgi:hypothetical protein